MGLVDGLLAREKHTFSSPLPIEACRQNIGWGVAPFGPGRLSPSPFLVIGVALVAGVALAKWIDWRGHAHPRW